MAPPKCTFCQLSRDAAKLAALTSTHVRSATSSSVATLRAEPFLLAARASWPSHAASVDWLAHRRSWARPMATLASKSRVMGQSPRLQSNVHSDRRFKGSGGRDPDANQRCKHHLSHAILVAIPPRWMASPSERAARRRRPRGRQCCAGARRPTDRGGPYRQSTITWRYAC